ncbi:hypothetical protein D9615_005056 [Tricholomella constricta]|uniref:Aminoglycoside phosphotransferase domain-containing protein n=1 Tax=Tricholomella constricta TaxID=117010 RepID=A0A8H5HH50_9AGAR|nr:hypothetical protein D9615_005056 [Tricholomella constricta]
MDLTDCECSSDVSTEESYSSDEFPPLEPDLDKLMAHVSQVVEMKLALAKKLTRGRYHEIYTLHCPERQWSCIARLSRFQESPSKLSSEVATMEYVRTHTRIPVPKVYCHDFSTCSVGVQFVVMERMPGQHLYRIWEDLTLDHKMAALSQIAQVLGQLSQLEFQEIGSLTEDFKVGPLIRIDNLDDLNPTTSLTGPYKSTFDYLASFIDGESSRFADTPDDVGPILVDVKTTIQEYCVRRASSSTIRPPFRLYHDDFDAQNMLFSNPTNDEPPRLTGIIDWEYAHTAPLYFLYEYPIFIQDNDCEKSAYATNAILRPHFVRELRAQFPRGSMASIEAKECMTAKCSTLNTFRDLFMFSGIEWDMLKPSVLGYLREEAEGVGKAYRGRLDWVPDPELGIEEKE